ncbi:MAG: SDR family NAD(P)-dependent oxidoreductase [Alphaproteobacteria bacterium]
MDSSTRRPLALVTGASRGIGAALARELAGHGHDLVLSGRSTEQMQELAQEFRRIGVETTVIAADLSQPGAAAQLAGDIERRGLSIDVLINNAGLGGLGRFDRIDPARVAEMLQINIVALTELTRLLLPGMIARGHGRIMLVGSVAGFQPGPGAAVYYASKAYVLSLGEALAHELRGTGVTVTTLCPGATATDFFEVAGARHAVIARRLRHMMPADRVARIGYQALMVGRRIVIAGVINRLMAFGGRHAPRAATLPITERLMTD